MINRRQAIKTLVAAPIVALPLSSSEAKANTNTVNNGVPVIKFSTLVNISNLEEIFKDAPWIADKCGREPQTHVFRQEAMAWLPKDRAMLLLENAEKFYNYVFENFAAYGLVLLVRYKYCSETREGISRVIIVKTAKSTTSRCVIDMSIPSNIDWQTL